MSRSGARFWIAMALAAVSCGLAACSARSAPRVWRELAPGPVFRAELELNAAQALRIETQTSAGSSSGAPVLHLWDLAAQHEVARAAPAWLRREATLEYTNVASATRRYALIMHARVDEIGHVSLLRDGVLWKRDVSVAGVTRPIATGRGYVLRASHAVGSHATITLYALDASGAIVRWTDPQPPFGSRPLPLDARSTAFLIGSSGVGRTNVYVNDPADADGDGVGDALERALGTVSQRANTRDAAPASDSDRDGLSDVDELFGVPERALDLPAWGADPRHKDVFVEVDHHKSLSDAGLDEADFAQVAAFFARGSAASLQNPDQQAGVHLHFDAGFAPTQPAHLGLVGDWGGASVSNTHDYKKALTHDFTSARRGYFRYALITRSGTGQASGSAFTINRNFHRAPVFAHELAHTFGLEHHGADSWGQLNCKPNYFSLMNYVFQNRDDIGFSRRAGTELNPSHVRERGGLGQLPANALREPPFELDVRGHDVDWNRDGLISDVPVRAALSFATYKSCGTASRARTTLAESPVGVASPVLVHLGAELHALFLDQHAQLMWSHGAVSGPDAQGSCPQGDTATSRCMSWQTPQPVSGLGELRELAAVAIDARQIALAYVSRAPDAHVGVAVLQLGETAQVMSDSVIPGLASTQPLSIAWRRVERANGSATRVLSVFVQAEADACQRADEDAPAGRLLIASAENINAPFSVQEARDTQGEPIVLSHGPSFAALGTGELCGALPDPAGYLRFFCYDATTQRYLDLSAHAFYAGLGPETAGHVGIAYHRFRRADGQPVDANDASRGAVYLSFTTHDSHGNQNPELLISEWLSARDGANARAGIDFRWQGSLIDQWTRLAAGSAATLYEDESLSALKAILCLETKQGPRIELLPLADGAFDETLRAGDDFAVMAQGICRKLRGAHACGLSH